MKAKRKANLLHPVIASVLFLIVLLFLPAVVSSEETYKFKRMWPTLQQPWYFNRLIELAVDSNGFVYVADSYNDRIQKFTSNGQFVTKWGSSGIGDGEFNLPKGIAVDSNFFVYVIDRGNYRIQKFTSNGQFVTKWGSQGTADGQFSDPYGIAVDSNGLIYVSDKSRVQKFTTDGEFVSKWGSRGSGDGQFNQPYGIAVDYDGFVYVADSSNRRIQKFTSDGEFVSKWGSGGSGDGQFNQPYGIAVDYDGFVYVADSSNRRIQKFTSDGQFVTKWGSQNTEYGQINITIGVAVDSKGFAYVADSNYIADFHNNFIQKFTTQGQFVTKWGSSGIGDGEFNLPKGIAVDSNGFTYVVDYNNNRIQKFTSDGQFVTKWGSWILDGGRFNFPEAIAVDSNGFVYVADTWGHCVQKFTSDGQFVTKWGEMGDGDGEFEEPRGIAVDGNGFVYVTDSGSLLYNDRIQKFTSDGQFVTKWGTSGDGDGEFFFPIGITVDNSGFAYVADWGNNRIQKFTSDGQFVTKWGSTGSGDGQFDEPWGIATDVSGFVYVSDSYNNRIQKFTPDGTFITKWGDHGSAPNQFNLPHGLTVSSSGNVYVSDSQNNRIQVFKPVTVSSNSKAIIVAGGAYEGNTLWEATQMSANFAYRTFTYQGFTKESIYYLTSDTGLDLDNNGIADDVDGNATNANLQNAILNWASNAESLILYLVDHGGNNTFRMSGTEILSASDLDIWLDTLQAAMPGKVIVVYDACESGSFVSALTPPAGKERIVVASTSPGEDAYFVTQGTISFSNYFWTNIFNGVNIKESFDFASDALGQSITFQTPMLDDNGNGIGNETEDGALAQNTYIGNGTVIYGDAPLIGSVSDDQTIDGTATATLTAYNVTDDDGIARVWAVIRTPDYNQGSTINPVQGLPSIDFMPVGGDQYEADYNGFNIEGTYQIAIYARDRIGNTSVPKLTTVSVTNPLRRKAIIVAGGSQSDALWPAIETNVLLAYEALKFQGYSDYDIFFMSPVTFSTGIDGTSTLGNLEYAINTWAASSTQDVVLYMIGNGGEGAFEINDTETLLADGDPDNYDLDTWLDNLQGSIPGKVTVVYDASRSGSFISALIPPAGKQRILLSSTDSSNSAAFLSNGDISFSKYFWSRVLNGTNLRDSFIYAKSAMSFSYRRQTAQIDDNGNGICNEKSDGSIAKYYTIGSGIMLAGDEPIIGSIMPPEVLHGETSATIWAEVTTTGTIDRVWAVITPPGYEPWPPDDPVITLPEITLNHVGNNKYEGTYNDFSKFGVYGVTVYAMDTEGNISAPAESTVQQMSGPDIYEDDDSYEQANVIVLNDPEVQQHNFHDAGDEDWVKFYALQNEVYEVRASNLGSSSDVVLELYNAYGMPLVPPVYADNTGAGDPLGEFLSWTCPAEGIYYVKVRQYDPAVSGENTEYDLEVDRPCGETYSGHVYGQVIDVTTGFPIEGVPVVIDGKYSHISEEGTGFYVMMVYMDTSPKSLPVRATKSGYIPYTGTVTAIGGKWVPKDILMTPECTDNDGDGYGNPGSSYCTYSATDCDDEDAAVNPGATEVCDGIDNNCDGNIDEGFPTQPWYRDIDGDGYGNPAIWQDRCSQPVGGWIADSTDCDDNDANIYPEGPPVRIYRASPAYFDFLQDAYDNAVDGDTIQCQDTAFTEDINIYDPDDPLKTVTIVGGWDCSYSTITGDTTITGNITIDSGTVSIDNVVLE